MTKQETLSFLVWLGEQPEELVPCMKIFIRLYMDNPEFRTMTPEEQYNRAGGVIATEQQEEVA